MVYKLSGHRVQLSVDSNGTPLCSCCHQPMVEAEPGIWGCAFRAAAENDLRAMLRAAVAEEDWL